MTLQYSRYLFTGQSAQSMRLTAIHILGAPLCSEFQAKDETKDILLAGENAALFGQCNIAGQIPDGRVRRLDV
jgi:hypothetical protein